MRLAIMVVVLAVALSASDTFADGMTPPPAPPSPRQPVKSPLGVVKAVVVKSCGSGSGGLAWDYLNANWPYHGDIPIFIDPMSLQHVASFTLADLQNSGADVVIVSDPAGGTKQWTPAEVSALASYANAGHPLIGTYKLLQYSAADNRILAPLWGLRSDLSYNLEEVQAAPWAEILSPSSCLFDRIVNRFYQGGYSKVEVPVDGSWDPEDLAG